MVNMENSPPLLQEIWQKLARLPTKNTLINKLTFKNSSITYGRKRDKNRRVVHHHLRSADDVVLISENPDELKTTIIEQLNQASLQHRKYQTKERSEHKK